MARVCSKRTKNLIEFDSLSLAVPVSALPAEDVLQENKENMV